MDGDDEVRGLGPGKDGIMGGPGNDILYGGPGGDSLLGRQGQRRHLWRGMATIFFGPKMGIGTKVYGGKGKRAEDAPENSRADIGEDLLDRALRQRDKPRFVSA